MVVIDLPKLFTLVRRGWPGNVAGHGMADVGI